MGDISRAKPSTTTAIQARDPETSIVENSMTVSLGKPLPSNLAHYHSDVTQSTVTMKVVTENNEASLFESNAIYILSAVGAVVVVALATAILLSIILICKHREKIFRGKLKRSNTSQSSNTSDFVYNSTYQWTCRHTRLLPHLRPDTTSYQSHWSLTGDHTKSQSKNSSNCPSPSQAHIHNASNLQPDGSTNDNHTTITCEMSTNDADDTEPQGECILIENRVLCTETNDCLEIQECNSEQSSPIDSCVKTSTHAEKSSKEQGKNEDSVFVEIHGNGMAAETCNMYRNPLYSKKRELLKKAEEETLKTTGERDMEGEGEGEGEKEKEEGEDGEREEEREELGEAEELEEDHISIAYYSIPKKPTISFVISDDEEEREETGKEREERERKREREREEREMEREREREMEREKQDQKWEEEEDLEEDRVSKASSVYYSIPKKPFSSFIFSDSDTYDSGNASTVSTDLSTQLSSTQTPYYTFRAYTATPAVKERGLVESNSFEFTDSITYGTILKKGSGYLV